MSRNCCNNEPSYCNNNCCTPCNGCDNGVSGLGGFGFYILAIFLLFGGGGFGPGSFWGDYGKIFRCGGFNNGWCDNSQFNNGSFTNNISNTNLSNSNLAGLLGGLSNNSNFDISNLTDSYN